MTWPDFQSCASGIVLIFSIAFAGIRMPRRTLVHTPESLAALFLLEKTFDLTPQLVMKTNKGEHHYFRRASGTYAKLDSHSTQEHPDRLEIKTGRGLAVLSGPGRFTEIKSKVFISIKQWHQTL